MLARERLGCGSSATAEDENVLRNLPQGYLWSRRKAHGGGIVASSAMFLRSFKIIREVVVLDATKTLQKTKVSTVLHDVLVCL